MTNRKAEHLTLCATDRVNFKQKTTLLEEVQLIHCALPECHLDDIDLSLSVFGKTLQLPLLISGMTGGADEAVPFNRAIARLAQDRGLALGLGSMRPLLERGDRRGYFLREHAPDTLIFGNIGITQATTCSSEALNQLVKQTQVDALVIHLNPAQEAIQPQGDRNFSGGAATFKRLSHELSCPIIAKETGCGISNAIGQTLKSSGVKWVDIAGAGGTSWVGVETLRARATQATGEAFWDWGIPTAASLLLIKDSKLNTIASGGLRSGLDVARAISLGATLGGIARPFWQAWTLSGEDGLNGLVDQLEAELRLALFLTGCPNLSALKAHRPMLGPTLTRWARHASS